MQRPVFGVRLSWHIPITSTTGSRSDASSSNFGICIQIETRADIRRFAGHGTFVEEIKKRGYKPRTVREWVISYEVSAGLRPPEDTPSAKRKARRKEVRSEPKPVDVAPPTKSDLKELKNNVREIRGAAQRPTAADVLGLFNAFRRLTKDLFYNCPKPRTEEERQDLYGTISALLSDLNAIEYQYQPSHWEAPTFTEVVQ